MLRTEDRDPVERDRDTWKSQASSGGTLEGVSLEPDAAPFHSKPSAQSLAVVFSARTAMEIFASHLGKFPRNPDKSIGVFFLFLINMSSLAFKTN